MIDDVRDFFKETEDSFTIYVVEQQFAVGRGLDYFKSFKGKLNYIDSDAIIKKRINKILQTISKNIPDSANIIKNCFNFSPIGVVEVISSLSKIFTTTYHQAVGPDVLDPIIIQEGKIMPRYVNQIIALHESSILRPVIIILLKDNNFDRAKEVLSECPHNTNIKMIRNSGESEIYKVINRGVDNPNDFLDAFAHHCFSTCSNTARKVLYDKEWSENSIIRLYAPIIMQMRTSFLFRDKTLVRNSLDALVTEISNKTGGNKFDDEILRSFECMTKLFRVFCNDGGKQDIWDAYRLAQDLKSEVLMAHVYRNAFFLDNYSFNEKQQLLDIAYNTFTINGMKDHAIYCQNNKLVRQFDTDNVSVHDFLSLQEEAIHNVPGLVGMSHILNNVGAAHLVNGYPDESISFFDKGLDYAFRPERCLQKIALLSNRVIAKSYCFEYIDENELRKIMNIIFDNKEVLNLPFLVARYVLNVISVAFNQSQDLGQELLQSYPVGLLIKNAFADNTLGTGQILLHIQVLEKKYDKFKLLPPCEAPEHIIDAMGIRKSFIIKNAFNPFAFSTWF